LELARDRVGPYIRALQAGLYALAPGDDHVPLHEALDHLAALDPDLSGDVLLPAEVDDRSGLPAFVWLSRARAEQALAREAGAGVSAVDEDLQRLRQLDGDLADRIRARSLLHEHLRNSALLPASRLQVVPRKRGATEEYRAAYDCLSATGLWVRIHADLSGPPGWSEGLLTLRRDGSVHARSGLLHLFARHAATPLLALSEQLAAGTGARTSRLARSAVGPFWFPGFPHPAGLPDELSHGLLLHLVSEVVGDDVHQSSTQDPLHRLDPAESAPDGAGIYRERRFAASSSLTEAVHDWARQRGCEVSVVSLG
jgi:hypothetical protein